MPQFFLVPFRCYEFIVPNPVTDSQFHGFGKDMIDKRTRPWPLFLLGRNKRLSTCHKTGSSYFWIEKRMFSVFVLSDQVFV